MDSGMGSLLASLLIFGVACSAPAVRPSLPAPQPAAPATTSPTVSPPGIWSFAYKAGVASYQVSRTALIENPSDSTPGREVTTNLTHELLTVERVGDTIRFTIAADTFATTTQGLSGTVQSVALPVHISGSLTPGSTGVSLDSAAEVCNPAQSALTSDLYSLVAPFPAQLSPGMTWRDSVELRGCQGMIPTRANIDRVYTVTGEMVYNGIPAVAIQRRDSIRAHGEGAQQQHRMIIDAAGSGSALMYLSIISGRIVGVTTTQDLDLSISASGRTHHFKQSLKQELVSTP